MVEVSKGCKEWAIWNMVGEAPRTGSTDDDPYDDTRVVLEE